MKMEERKREEGNCDQLENEKREKRRETQITQLASFRSDFQFYQDDKSFDLFYTTDNMSK